MVRLNHFFLKVRRNKSHVHEPFKKKAVQPHRENGWILMYGNPETLKSNSHKNKNRPACFILMLPVANCQ